MFPEFFARVPGIALYDPLAELLGSAEGGIIEYRYEDAVRLAGHSCPTVAGAWLMTRTALRALYGEAMPHRGGLRVDFAENMDSGVTGVIASVATLITGAAGAGGFKGLGGRFSRRNLLRFGVEGVADLRFTRLDNAAAVHCRFLPNSVAADPRLGELLPAVVQDQASAEDRQLFGLLWQDRVRRLLLDHADDPAVVRITPAL